MAKASSRSSTAKTGSNQQVSTLEVHSGYLTVKMPGRFRAKTLSNCWCVLYAGISATPPRLTISEDKKIIDPSFIKESLNISDAFWCQPKTSSSSVSSSHSSSQSHSRQPDDFYFCFSTSAGKQYVFTTLTLADREMWCRYMCCVSPRLLSTYRLSRGDGGGGKEDYYDYDATVTKRVPSISDVSFFDVIPVKNHQTNHSPKFRLIGLLKMRIDSQHIGLFSPNGRDLLAQWSYFEVRSVGHGSNTMAITVGRRASTGEGTFDFFTIESGTIVHFINFHIKEIRRRASMI